MKFLFRKFKVVVFLFFLVFLTYGNSLNNDFVSDDIAGIQNNPEISNITYFISRPFNFLLPLEHYLIAKAFGITAWPFRLLNIIFHLGNCLLLYFFISILIAPRAALLASSILAVHPLQVEGVSWISGGPYAQYTFFLLLSLFFYYMDSRFRGNDNKRRSGGLNLRYEEFFYFLSLISFIFSSIVGAQRAAIFPLTLFVFIISFYDLKKDWKRVIPFLIIGMLWVLSSISWIGLRVASLQADYYQQPQVLNPLIQIPVAISSYLELIFWPKALTLYHSEISFTISQYLLKLAVFILFLAAIVYSYKRNRHIFFWLCFFIIILLPTLTPFGINWVVAERYCYPAAIGIYVVIAIILDKAARFKKIQVMIYLFFIALIILLGARTILRNIDWKNQDNLWFATAKASPTCANTHNNLGDVYARHNDLKRAAEEFKKAISLNPRYADAWHNLGNIYFEMGKLSEAEFAFKAAISFNSRLSQSYQNLAVIYYHMKKQDLAKEYLEKAIELMKR